MGLLQNKICLVTGTSRGIGACIVRRFAQEGAVVYANARMPGSIDSVCRELSGTYHTDIIPVYFDVRDQAGARKAFLQIRRERAGLDVLVNNAGVMQDALTGMITREQMEETFTTNICAVIDMLQIAARIMVSHKSGSIINMSSIVGLEGNPGQLVYSASKGAVLALTKTAAKELAPDNVRVNAVAPGMIDTDMFHSIGEKNVQDRIRNIRMGRLGTPEDVADAVVFLASDMSGYKTGEVIGVRGGAVI